MDGVEVKSGTATTLTCKMTGLKIDEPLKVLWLQGNGDPIPPNEPGITYDPSPNPKVGKFYSDYVRIGFRNFPYPLPLTLLTLLVLSI